MTQSLDHYQCFQDWILLLFPEEQCLTGLGGIVSTDITLSLQICHVRQPLVWRVVKHDYGDCCVFSMSLAKGKVHIIRICRFWALPIRPQKCWNRLNYIHKLAIEQPSRSVPLKSTSFYCHVFHVTPMTQTVLETHHARFTLEVILFPPVITNVHTMN